MRGDKTMYPTQAFECSYEYGACGYIFTMRASSLWLGNSIAVLNISERSTVITESEIIINSVRENAKNIT